MTTTIDGRPTLRARNCLGRIAYSIQDHRDVEPIHYVYDAPWIFRRTSRGAPVTNDDLSPPRDIVFGVHLSDLPGRCSVSNGTQRLSVPVGA
jgi:hypothetical protein